MLRITANSAPKIDWTEDMVVALLLGWLNVHPKLCAEELGEFDLREALRALKGVAYDLREPMLLLKNKAKDPADPIQILCQGFSEQLEAMFQSGCKDTLIRRAMKRLVVKS